VALDQLLRTLDPDRRAALVLTQLLGLSYEEAPEVCGCPVGTIRSRVSRARADLVAAMAPGAEEASG
jgi:RNA polymerase sigma-70 factor (ECF subfamily)